MPPKAAAKPSAKATTKAATKPSAKQATKPTAKRAAKKETEKQPTDAQDSAQDASQDASNNTNQDINQDTDKQPSMFEKKRYICEYSQKLNKEDAVDVGMILVRNGLTESIKYNMDGARIDLDNIKENQESIINQLYHIIYHKLNKHQ